MIAKDWTKVFLVLMGAWEHKTKNKTTGDYTSGARGPQSSLLGAIREDQKEASEATALPILHLNPNLLAYQRTGLLI